MEAKPTLWQRLFRGVRRLKQEPGWAQFAGADWADRIMNVAVTDRFHAKQGRSIGRWVLEMGDRRLVVYLKRHYRLPWWCGLLATVRPEGNWSPALQEWEHLEWAREQRLPVPRAVAAGEYIGPWGRLQSFLAVEELTGMAALHEAVPAAARQLDGATFRKWKRGLAVEMARIARDLHRRRWFHKDLYFCHFYIDEEDTRRVPESWVGRVRLIDLHRMAHHAWTWRVRQAKDLGQLLYSSEVDGVTDRDRVWFWRAYQEGQRPGWVDRWVARWARVKSWRYGRHNARKLHASAVS